MNEFSPRNRIFVEIGCRPLKHREVTQNLVAASVGHTLDVVLCGRNWQGLLSIYWASISGLACCLVSRSFDVFVPPVLEVLNTSEPPCFCPAANEVAASAS